MGLAKGRHIKLNQDDVDAIKQKISNTEMVDGKNTLGNWGSPHYMVQGNKSGSFGVTGTHANWEALEFVRIIEGRYINSLDEQEERKVAVIGNRVRDVLFKGEGDPIGKSINIRGVFFKVVGVYKSTEPDNIYQGVSVLIPNDSLRRAFNQLEGFNYIFFLPKAGVSGKSVEEQVIKLLYERKKISPEDKGVLAAFNMEEQYKNDRNLVEGVIGFSWLVAIGTIIAGVLGVGNIMLVIVKERTREIGLRKAMGATPMNISLMIMQESLVITIIAGYSGLVAGVLLLEGVKVLLVNIGQGDGMFASPFIDITTALMALGVLVVVGVLAAVLPALKAASVNPIAALQDE
ncbi:MAG: ABC transporter permease [Moraxellaceae bacterium]|nr:MAG: ABC transporter permease [Moraxellaceae bacterium]